MASINEHYPGDLNPFGSDDENTVQGENEQVTVFRGSRDNYPNYLSPFDEDENIEPGAGDDYDNSLNPFGDEESGEQHSKTEQLEKIRNTEPPNPFDELEDEDQPGETKAEACNDHAPENQDESEAKQPSIEIATQPASIQTTQLDLSEPPPVPLPRTKSLLKKEQALRSKQQTSQAASSSSNQANSLLSKNSSTSSSSITLTTIDATPNSNTTFQKKKNKRSAPPVPVNFKREVSGSLDVIEEELNDIGDKLAVMEEESNLCQENLKAAHESGETDRFDEEKSKFVSLIKKKNSIVRRQKELMYKKREMKLDQIHSDIEYELRMIGNKQLSNRTAEDEEREKDLLKKLVEIVEEKSDIVENLNKDTSCDNHDIKEAMRRLNINTDESPPLNECESKHETKKNKPSVLIKGENCDKTKTVDIGTRLSKIATLLPKSATIKDTMKIKRKRLFKRGESRQVE